MSWSIGRQGGRGSSQISSRRPWSVPPRVETMPAISSQKKSPRSRQVSPGETIPRRQIQGIRKREVFRFPVGGASVHHGTESQRFFQEIFIHGVVSLDLQMSASRPSSISEQPRRNPRRHRPCLRSGGRPPRRYLVFSARSRCPVTSTYRRPGDLAGGDRRLVAEVSEHGIGERSRSRTRLFYR